MDKNINIVIAGGKTGGHLFPGIAVAKALEEIADKNGHAANILFIGTDALFETKTLKRYGYSHRAIYSKPVKGRNIISKSFSLAVVVISLLQSLVILKNFKPHFALGVGGFSSFAVILAAVISGIPNAIQEQNAFPGMTNRMLSRFTKTIFTSFKNTEGFKDNPRVRYFGNPVRKDNTSIAVKDVDLKNYDPDKLTILVTGGSQGAASINSAFMDAIESMVKNKTGEDQFQPADFNIIHQTGVNDETGIREKYEKMRVTATASAFFHNMPELQTKADIIITRAGAGIIAEICNKGLPAIFIPFPYAADDHQKFNALELEREGAAMMIEEKDLTGKILKESMENLIKDKEKLKSMGKKLKEVAMPDADKKIASYILNRLGVNT